MAKRIFLITFTFSVFIGAFLLFLIQPIVAKLLLPILGGTSSVWNTCMVFFQATLLFGYLYAHLSMRFLSNRQQRILHLCVLGFGFLSLPITTRILAVPDKPLLWLFGILAMMVAAPFFALSATAPLFQGWFGQSNHPQRHNPYPLYSASNMGSILALLLYPIVFEGLFSTQTQSNIWSLSYLFFFALSAVIVAMTWRSSTTLKIESQPLSWGRRLLWVSSALIPASLVIGVTTHISMNIGSLPVFWVVPLAVYLLTFVIAFSSFGSKFSKVRLAVGPLVALAFCAQLVTLHWSLEAILHLGILFVVSLSFHIKLVEAAPSTGNLTQFYLFISLGGVLGASFNAVIAPTIFSTQYEYYIMLGVAVLLLYDKIVEGLPSTVKGFTITSIVVAITAGWFAFNKVELMQNYWDWIWGILIISAILFRRFPARRKTLAQSVLIMWAAVLMTGLGARHLYQGRSFYSTLVVDVKKQGPRVFHILAHGNTVHGVQEKNTDELIPLSYYHKEGAMGDVFKNRQKKDAIRVGVVGLGIGSLAAYNRPKDHMDFFEIDSAVADIANNAALFTFLPRAQGEVEVVIGDGRVKLDAYSGPLYDLLVVDAFNSDAIPTFLLTEEALSIFLAKIKDEGLLVFHTSSRYLNFEPILAKICAHLGMYSRALTFVPEGSSLDSPHPAKWVIIAKKKALLDAIKGEWKEIPFLENTPLWTDDHHNILSVLK